MDTLPPSPEAASPVPGKNEQTMGMLCHLLAFAGYLFPFGNIIGPLVLWLVKRQEMPFVESEGKESLNFQISMTIYTFVSFILCFVLIGFVLLPAVIIADIVFIIIAAIKTANGESYRYPLCIRLIK